MSIGVIEITELISKTMDSLIDFLVGDEKLSGEFELYLTRNKIEIERESELNDILIDYILEAKMNDGMSVLDYYLLKNDFKNREIVASLQKSFVSIFRINKILKNAFETNCILSKKEYTLIPLVKTTSLRGIGLYDYIKARTFEFQNNFYLLEIYDCISQYKEHIANLEGVKAIIRNPKVPFINNPDLISDTVNSIKSFHSSFFEYFKKEEIILHNKDVDSVLEDFHLFHKGESENVFDKEEFEITKGDFFEIDEFEDENLLKNALFGFSSSKKEYDVGLYFDPSKGLFIIPFLGSLNFFLKNENELSKEALSCIKYFVLNNKVTPELLRKKQSEYPSLLSNINKALSKNFNSIEEVIKTHKEEFLDPLMFSSVNVLFESEVFSRLIGYKEDKETKTVGRNDPCPCGSGKKYKKCCLLKKGV